MYLIQNLLFAVGVDAPLVLDPTLCALVIPSITHAGGWGAMQRFTPPLASYQLSNGTRVNIVMVVLYVHSTEYMYRPRVGLTSNCSVPQCCGETPNACGMEKACPDALRSIIIGQIFCRRPTYITQQSRKISQLSNLLLRHLRCEYQSDSRFLLRCAL